MVLGVPNKYELCLNLHALHRTNMSQLSYSVSLLFSFYQLHLPTCLHPCHPACLLKCPILCLFSPDCLSTETRISSPCHFVPYHTLAMSTLLYTMSSIITLSYFLWLELIYAVRGRSG